MRVLQGLFERDRKKHSLGICIPEATKRKTMEESLHKRKMVRGEIGTGSTPGSGSFQVTGIFHVHESLMVQGIVVEGAISKKGSTSFGGVKLKVIDLQLGGKSPGMLQEDDEGAIFFKAEKGKHPMLKVGDIIEF